MMANILPRPEVRGVGIVRDKHGNPKVDGNPEDLPEAVKSALSPDDWAYLRAKHGNS